MRELAKFVGLVMACAVGDAVAQHAYAQAVICGSGAIVMLILRHGVLRP